MKLDILFIKVNAFDTSGLKKQFENSDKSCPFLDFNPNKGISISSNNISLAEKNLSNMSLTNLNSRFTIFYPLFSLLTIFSI